MTQDTTSLYQKVQDMINLEGDLKTSGKERDQDVLDFGRYLGEIETSRWTSDDNRLSTLEKIARSVGGTALVGSIEFALELDGMVQGKYLTSDTRKLYNYILSVSENLNGSPPSYSSNHSINRFSSVLDMDLAST